MTGIGAYTHCLLASAANHAQSHSYLTIRKPDGPRLVANGPVDIRELTIESPNQLWEQLQLPTELKFWKIDLYHSPLFTCPIVDEVPSVITIHDAIPDARPDLCSPKFLEFYRSQIGPSLRAATRVITTSERSREEILKHLKVPGEKVSVVYQGIPDQFSPDKAGAVPNLRAKLNLPEKYILFVGMIEPRKNVERLVRAFGQIASDLPDHFLVLAGRKDDEAYSIGGAVQDSGVPHRIRELGYVAAEDLPALYAGAAVFAFPSLYEGFGRPVVEAMASGVPVVASNTTSLPEIVGDAGLLVDPEDTDALAQALLRVCKGDELRSVLIERGLERAKEFTLERFGQRLQTFYDEVGSELNGAPA